jgi:hypothetical protein
MKIDVYDTYVTKKNGQIMHFDVMAPEETPTERVLKFANTYLGSVGQAGQKCGVNECKFCHGEHARPEIEQSIRESGYYIVEMEGCG